MGKAVFIDVDGTLVNHRGLVPPSARAAVVAARANGHQVFLATGRSMSELWAEILEPGFDGVIAAAGGYIEYEGEVLAHQHIAVDDVRHAVDYFGRHRVSYLLETNNGIYGSPRAKHRLRELMRRGRRDRSPKSQ